MASDASEQLKVHSATSISSFEVAPNANAISVAAPKEVSNGTASHDRSQAPSVIYLRNIDAAKAGNARSQYRVAQALQTCRSAIKTEERLDEVIRTVPMSEEQTEELKRRFELCKSFPSLLSDIDGEITKWLHKSAEAGDPLAQSYEGLISYPNFESEELKSLVRKALSTGEQEAYAHAAMYYANVTPNDNLELYEAWKILSCERNASCDVVEERNRINSQYQMYQRMQIRDYEAELRNKLKKRQWDQLGF
jgi:hypothetical protein